MGRRRRRVVWVLAGLGAVVLLFVALCALNGLVLADRREPRMRHLAEVPAAATRSAPREVTLLSYNIAKGFAHRGTRHRVRKCGVALAGRWFRCG